MILLLSVSEFVVDPAAKVGRFRGTVSTNQGGGFASCRTKNFDPALNLGEFTGLELRVRGDGQRYKCTIRPCPP